MQKATFTGFCTDGEKSAKRAWVYQDKELVNKDLLNHFHTAKGDRLMRPEFGSDIHLYVMEPNTEMVRADILNEVTRVVSLDPRVRLEDIELYTRGHHIVVAVTLFYRQLETTDTLMLEFEKRQS